MPLPHGGFGRKRSQKFNFKPNCKSRMLVEVEVILPKLALTNVAFGEPQFG